MTVDKTQVAAPNIYFQNRELDQSHPLYQIVPYLDARSCLNLMEVSKTMRDKLTASIFCSDDSIQFTHTSAFTRTANLIYSNASLIYPKDPFSRLRLIHQTFDYARPEIMLLDNPNGPARRSATRINDIIDFMRRGERLPIVSASTLHPTNQLLIKNPIPISRDMNDFFRAICAAQEGNDYDTIAVHACELAVLLSELMKGPSAQSRAEIDRTLLDHITGFDIHCAALVIRSFISSGDDNVVMLGFKLVEHYLGVLRECATYHEVLRNIPEGHRHRFNEECAEQQYADCRVELLDDENLMAILSQWLTDPVKQSVALNALNVFFYSLYEQSFDVFHDMDSREKYYAFPKPSEISPEGSVAERGQILDRYMVPSLKFVLNNNEVNTDFHDLASDIVMLMYSWVEMPYFDRELMEIAINRLFKDPGHDHPIKHFIIGLIYSQAMSGRIFSELFCEAGEFAQMSLDQISDYGGQYDDDGSSDSLYLAAANIIGRDLAESENLRDKLPILSLADEKGVVGAVKSKRTNSAVIHLK